MDRNENKVILMAHLCHHRIKFCENKNLPLKVPCSRSSENLISFNVFEGETLHKSIMASWDLVFVLQHVYLIPKRPLSSLYLVST